jgi:hypothetical protein
LLAALAGATALAGCGLVDGGSLNDGGAGGSTGTAGSTGAGGSGGGAVCGGIAGLICPHGQFCEFPAGVCSSIADGTGVCKVQLTGGCPEIYAPVCGCDSRTYSNDCERQAAGVSALHTGECQSGGEGASCEGLAGGRCAPGLYCEFPTGVCSSILDASGTCRRAPQACDDIFQPVCGCNNRTYGNDCDRQNAGVSLLHTGACDTQGGGEGAMCSGIAGLPCASGLFCEFATGVCSSIADATGTCRRLPQACTLIHSPVCGCDNQTYGNDCARQGAGVSLLHTGACRNGAEGAVCGGLAGFPCNAGLFCEEEPGVCAIIADGTGICRPQPQGCTREYAPVCGCDRVTYSNDCTRAAAGVSKVHDGPC